jgi:hypothetical protein
VPQRVVDRLEVSSTSFSSIRFASPVSASVVAIDRFSLSTLNCRAATLNVISIPPATRPPQG